MSNNIKEKIRLKGMVEGDATSSTCMSYTNVPSYSDRLFGKSPKNKELGTLSSSDASIFLFRRDFALNLYNGDKMWT